MATETPANLGPNSKAYGALVGVLVGELLNWAVTSYGLPDFLGNPDIQELVTRLIIDGIATAGAVWWFPANTGTAQGSPQS